MVRAEIVAQHESVSTLLSRELGQLKNALEGQGLVVDRLSVTTMSATPPTSQSNGSSSWQAGEEGRSRGQFERDGRDQPSQRQTKGEKQSEFERAMLNLVA
jgi:flagellar hook-length control protein FliK